MSKKLNEFSKEEFYKYYITDNHTVIETQHYFHIGGNRFDECRKKWNIYKDENKKQDILRKRREKRIQTLEQRYSFSKEDIINYYIIENHSFSDTIEYFNISQSMFCGLIKRWSLKKSKDEIYDAMITRTKVTNNKKMGCDWPTQNKSTISKQLKTKESRYGDAHYNNTLKNIETNKNNHNGHIDRNVNEILSTKKKNKTFNTSSIEQNLYTELTKLFNADDVIQQYQDYRYANPKTKRRWLCDFYIKSLDLFIEVNFYAGHGPHIFNPSNPEDIKLLNKWESRKGFYKTLKTGKLRKNCYWGFINTWTVIDPLKIDIAKNNKLNYVTLYNNEELKKFLNSLASKNKKE